MLDKKLNETLVTISEMNSQKTDGKWLEKLTIECGNIIAEWDLCDLQKPKNDIGIDVEARRKSDGELVAIQCKSRKLDENGNGRDVTKSELDSFISASSHEKYKERWVVTNGDVKLGKNAIQAAGQEKPIKWINIHADVLRQHDANSFSEKLEENSTDTKGAQSAKLTRDYMQKEAISHSIKRLKVFAETNGGKSRGRIILPCGTGKSRIALRIIEELTEPGEISAILCPSIALVAQLRREFLNSANQQINALAVCSDPTTGQHIPSNLSKDPTADISQTSVAEVKGLVTTNPCQIEKWMRGVISDKKRIGVIFGTYQSSHRISEALLHSGINLTVMVADEAQRTAGLRRIKAQEEKIRNFTVCHDDKLFPVKYRIYQTATPKVYDVGGGGHVK